ncbi:MAG: hypothetical protein P4L42_06925 [Desulfocapsaceae bacterium]|nr:hypothetical protein [Desulfocapsaceae bacterium]
MIVVPKETPIIEGLNSYYLNIEKLFAYYQSILDGGCAFFQLPAAQGVIFFNASSLLEGTLREKTSFRMGQEAVEGIIDATKSKNVLISIYKVPAEKIPFWTSVANAEDLFKDLSTEFTDLEGLVRKMISDHLTGYIEVAFNDGEMAVLFLRNDQMVGMMSSAGGWRLLKTDKLPLELIEKSRKTGAVLNVRRIAPEKSVMVGPPLETEMPAREGGIPAFSQPGAAVSAPQAGQPILKIREMLQYLLLIYDKYISGNRKIQGDFQTILKRKFIERVDKYDFLDPFAADFRYAKGVMEYTGPVDDVRLATALLECLQEIAAENDMRAWLDKSMWPFKEKYSSEIDYLNVKI